MIDKIEIHESLPNDVILIEKLYPSAFPDEDLLPLVRDLLREAPIVLSLVGITDNALVGHVIFTTCSIAGRTDKVALLGPLAVAPAWQRLGIGSAIVRAGLRRLENAGVHQVYVLGDPAYYKRFGFEPNDGVTPPYPLPEEWRAAWQSLSLRGDKLPLHGKLSVNKPYGHLESLMRLGLHSFMGPEPSHRAGAETCEDTWWASTSAFDTSQSITQGETSKTAQICLPPVPTTAQSNPSWSRPFLVKHLHSASQGTDVRIGSLKILFAKI